MQIYLDNAATTPLHPQVIAKMTEIMTLGYGNPSATHSLGRKAKAELETARRTVAKYLNCLPSEIFFTGSGTEADNMAIRGAVHDLGIKHIISSPIEHKAVLKTIAELAADGLVESHHVKVDSYGRADLDDLRRLAELHPGALISLMHANNELGTLNDLEAISEIARENNCLFHSDTVQSLGHYKFDLQKLDVDFLACSAHKFHGPKGVGFLYKKKGIHLSPMITGGGQESNMRAGTENILCIAGLAEAFALATEEAESDREYVTGLKHFAMDFLKSNVSDIRFNGDVSDDGGLYTVLNVSFAAPDGNNAVIVAQMDLEGVCISGGSACNSGAIKMSHVMETIGHPVDRGSVRISFSKFTTKEEVEKGLSIFVDKLVVETASR